MNNEISVIKRDLDSTIKDFERVKEVAVYVATSEVFSKGFESKNADGTTKIDETTGKPLINVADVALCIMTGLELGLNLAGSLLYGKKLNQATYMSVMKGKSLGIDIATAIEKVVSIPTKNGYVSYTMVDIISAKLMQAQIEFLPFLRNYAPFYIYRDADNNELDLDKILDENDDLKSEYVVVDTTAKPDDIKKQVSDIKASGKIVVTKERHGYFTKAKFVRKYPDGRTVTHFQRFSTLDAERAELLPTYDAKGTVIQNGKDNWIHGTPQMMANRTISIGGRIIAADLLNGVYTREEVVNSGLIKEADAPIVDTVAEVIN